MKYFFTLIMIVLFANSTHSQNNYSRLWKEVEKFEIDGLPKSALEIVDQIANQAKSDNNSPEIIKTLLFKSKFALILEEDAQLKIITDFKSEIANSKTPTKNVIENILANLYWQYFQQNRWKFYNRTNTTEKVDVNDFRTWDLQTLFDEVHLLFQNSLQNGLLLQQANLNEFDVILHKQKDSKIYRPTVYDFLAHNALQFYKTTENSITQTAYKFQIDDYKFLSNAEKFAALNIISKDSTSLQLNALKIYQDLIQFHLKDTEPYALADLDIERLLFVKQFATFSDKNKALLKALTFESDRLKSHEISALYDYEIAKIYQEQGFTYKPKTDETHRWKLKDALELCNTIIDTYPKSKGAEKAKVLKQQIEQKSIQITTESFLPIQKDAKLLISYKNINNVSFTIYKISESDYKKLNKTYRQEEQLALINKLKNKITSWQSTLKNEGDYQNHSMEIAIPKLDNSRYLVFATPGFSDAAFAYQTLQVTDFALAEKIEPSKHTFQVIDRNNGQPITNANVKITYQKNYRGGFTTKRLVTNELGEVSISKTSDRLSNLLVEVNKNDDKGIFGDYYVNRNYNDDNDLKTQYKGFVFTDRSIYRPGQTVYFKGIALQTKDDKSEVLVDEKIGLVLQDVNGQEITKLELTTNEFGSISGEFILPNNVLTGIFRIYYNFQNIVGSHTFSVEEYKRPKFEATFNPVTETYKINDSVTVTGTALAYVGSNITDAKVVYRVHRKVQYPRWYSWYRPWTPSEPQEITFGETTTNNRGEFDITFKALPDESSDKANLPVFQYEVTADITDVNGETRSTKTIVNVGYHALIALVDVDGKLDKSNKYCELAIETKNLNGEFVPASGTIKIYKLQAPEFVLRSRPWQAPDYQSWSKEEFKNLFPHEAYSDEDNAQNWKKGDLVLEKAFDTETSKTLKLGNIKKWESGKYVIELVSKDQFGQLVKDETRTQVFSKKDKILADKQLFSIRTNKDTYKASENVILTLASASDNLAVTIDIEKNGAIIKTYIVRLNNNIKTLSIPVTKEDVGGFAIHYSYAAYNSSQSGTLNIDVPYPKTDLEIETLTFRDKLQPGAGETWQFKIKGPKGEKVAAELLASMYDASLDQFKSHNWNFNPIHKPTYYSQIRNNSNRTFATNNFRVYLPRVNYFEYPTQSYDQLNWFGFNLNNAQWARRHYLRSIRSKDAVVTSSYKKDIKEGTIKGTVKDELEQVLPGVNIIVKGTDRGVQTDFDGNFTIEAKKGETLEFSYVGFTNSKYLVEEKNHIIVTLFEDLEGLDEVVVTGYGMRRKVRSQTDAFLAESAVMEAADNVENDISNALSGKVAGVQIEENIPITQQENKETDFSGINIRKNLQETAFFFPHLQTDKDSNVSFSFTTPEALTKWKLQLLAHTKTLESAVSCLETVTQKELMVTPNAPRFLREGDQITISTKIANLADKNLTGEATLILTDAVTGTNISEKLIRSNAVEIFSVEKDGNTEVSWNLDIPDTVQAVQYKIIAKAGDFSDGEQNALPVLSNRMLVTETLPMWIRSNQTKTFTLDKLKNATSSTLKQHKLTLEMTSNPAWYAVQALPYLMEYPYDCNEQTFSRYYANALASHIANSNPRIQEVFNQWANTDALLSNLEKNQELKSLLIEETPWLRDAQSETEQKKRIALLFDLNKMNNELQSASRKLKNNQMSSGGWAWFNGGRENRWITQHIITGFGHLKQLNVILNESEESNMIEKAISYLDNEFVKEYQDIRKYNKGIDLSKDHLSYTQLHYLYMRSFFPDVKASKQVREIQQYYLTQIQKYWLSRPLYAKGLMALVTERTDDNTTAKKILKSLKENSITSEELGMYWKENTNSWYWYQAPIETQALLIEVFSEVGHVIQSEAKNLNDIDNLKIWLLKNKQTNRWKTTKATTEAVYALLLQGSDWLSVRDMVDVVLGDIAISPSKLEDVKVEAGTGYYKTSWSSSEIKPKMADVKITKKGDGIAWGSLYWQYFEDLDKITSTETPLQLKKKLFLKTNTDKGEQITAITDSTNLQVGDLVRVRIELRSDRAMEFIHMKDMRASGLEPVNVLSQYKWQDGLGYYESTKDASTNFFFDYLPKGVYVFEYDLRVNNAGIMSNGISTIQSMYAPEFSSHSEGLRINVN